MGFRRTAVIMAGGSGTRFWPVSTSQRPKQFLKLASPTATLLEQSIERILPIVGDNLSIATTAPLVEATRSAAPGRQVFGEPAKRNTLGALVWATANLRAHFGEMWTDISVAILTADHLIAPAAGFQRTVNSALDLAERESCLVTIGIEPCRPATEYGYIEVGEMIAERQWRAKRFAEKPNPETARRFVDAGNFLWNSGMFFWTLESFCAALADAQPAAEAILERIAASLSADDLEAAEQEFEALESTSIDYALMESAKNVAVVAADFTWDDLGSWDALSRSLEADDQGNVSIGSVRSSECDGCVVYNDTSEQRVTIHGLHDVVVAVTDQEVLVCSKDRSQEVRDLAH